MARETRGRIPRRSGLALAVAIGAVTGALGGRHRRFAIADRSMEPALRPGDWVLARRLDRRPTRGAIVVLRAAGAERYLVKRVVGLAGETITIAAGRVAVDGRLLDEPWTFDDTEPAGVWDVPEDAVFVLGDRRPYSADDSRSVGFVPVESLIGEVRLRYWPRARIGLVRP